VCGIAGIVRSDGAPVDRELLARMNAAIRHRGPDDDGFYFSDGVGLATRRLSHQQREAGTAAGLEKDMLSAELKTATCPAATQATAKLSAANASRSGKDRAGDKRHVKPAHTYAD